ncbi:MAG TPA: archease [Anaerolineales bacterium]|nr:archease [Anaerolineales bacterium]
MSSTKSGYREIEHTADWEIEVWAPNPAELFIQAARAMMTLSGLRLESEPKIDRGFSLQAVDLEGLLVAFLSEILFYAEQENLGFEHYHLTIENFALSAHLKGAPIRSIDKEIKAVTYHRLAITQTQDGLNTRLVFDV